MINPAPGRRFRTARVRAVSTVSAEAHPDVIAEIRRLRRKPRGSKAANGKKRMTFAQVAEELNAGGYQSASGRPFTEGMVKVLVHRLGK